MALSSSLLAAFEMGSTSLSYAFRWSAGFTASMRIEAVRGLASGGAAVNS
jgi:hypothetical protein